MIRHYVLAHALVTSLWGGKASFCFAGPDQMAAFYHELNEQAWFYCRTPVEAADDLDTLARNTSGKS